MVPRDWFQDPLKYQNLRMLKSLIKMVKYSLPSVSAGSTSADSTNSGLESAHGEPADTEGRL